MNLEFSAEDNAFRAEVRAWLEENYPKDIAARQAEGDDLRKDDVMRWHQILAKKGWAVPSWPKEWGGTDWSITQKHIFASECAKAGAPGLIPLGLGSDGGGSTRLPSA